MSRPNCVEADEIVESENGYIHFRRNAGKFKASRNHASAYSANHQNKPHSTPPIIGASVSDERPSSSYVSQTAHARYSRDICGFEFC